MWFKNYETDCVKIELCKLLPLHGAWWIKASYMFCLWEDSTHYSDQGMGQATKDLWFSSLQNLKVGSATHSVSYSMGSESSFLNASGVWGWQLIFICANLKYQIYIKYIQ
jgi:hypothetical protein